MEMELDTGHISSASAASSSHSDTVEKNLEGILQQMLPPNYEHIILSVDEVQPYHKDTQYVQSYQNDMFAALFRINLRNKDEACQWLEDFKQSSFTDWRIRKCFQENTPCRVFKKGYRCHHDTMPQNIKKKPHSKHTKCKAFLYITIKNPDMSRSADKLLKEFPCEINLHHCHNHPIMANEVLQHRKPTPRIEKLFMEMYKKGHTPTSALAAHKYDIQLKHPEDWPEHLADGSKCPKLSWCYHIYRQRFLKEKEATPIVESLLVAIDKYNVECGDVCAKAETLRTSDLVVAMCSPLMKRVHQLLSSSGEITFLISERPMDQHNTRIYTFLASSVAGVLPLGVIFSSSESQSVLSVGMTLLQSIMPPDAFYGRGPSQGPQIIMTNDVSQERDVLSSSFPGAILLFRLFSVLQAFWRYVWNNKHKIDEKDKLQMYLAFQKWCYSESQEEFLRQYNDMLCNPIVAQNPIVAKQLKSWCERAGEWAPCYQINLTGGDDSKDYSERTILWYNIEILERVITYNTLLLFEFFSTKIDTFFENQITAVFNNQIENYWSSKHFINAAYLSKIDTLQCSQVYYEGFYLVENVEKRSENIVNMHVQVCSCPIGKNGAPCEHLFAAAQHFQQTIVLYLPYADEEAQTILHQIMSADSAQPKLNAECASLESDSEMPISYGTIGKLEPEETAHCVPIECDTEIVISCGSSEGIIFKSTSPEEDSSLHDYDVHDSESTVITVQDLLASTSDTDLPSTQAKALELWQSMNDFIVTGLQERPDMFAGPVMNFASEFMKAKDRSENDAIPALDNFSLILADISLLMQQQR